MWIEKMKKRLTRAWALMLIVIFLPQLSISEITIRLSHVAPNSGHPKGDAAVLLAKRVNEEMVGKVNMKVYPNGSLFGDNVVLEEMLKGNVEMAIPSLSQLESYTTKFRVFDLPFLFKNIEIVDTFQKSQTGQELLKSMESKGLIGLQFWHNGMKQISANKPISLPKDVEGLRFRIQPSEVIKAQFSALGATSKVIPYNKVFDSLRSGEVDGQENTWSNIYTKKFHITQDGITESNHGVLDYIVVTSADFWYGLSEDIREQLSTILAEVTEESNGKSLSSNQESRQNILDAGVEIRELTESQRSVWVRAMAPVWNRFARDIGNDLLQAAINSAEK
jgi:C4-dicarboxylate-binding protein DctP